MQVVAICVAEVVLRTGDEYEPWIGVLSSLGQKVKIHDSCWCAWFKVVIFEDNYGQLWTIFCI